MQAGCAGVLPACGGHGPVGHRQTGQWERSSSCARYCRTKCGLELFQPPGGGDMRLRDPKSRMIINLLVNWKFRSVVGHGPCRVTGQDPIAPGSAAEKTQGWNSLEI